MAESQKVTTPVRQLLLVIAFAAAVPGGMLLEPLFERPEIELLRQALGPILIAPAWITALLSALTAVGTLVFWIAQYQTRPLGTERRTQALFIVASVIQAPAVLAVMVRLLGAPWAPVLASVGISTAGVLGLGVIAVWGRPAHADEERRG